MKKFLIVALTLIITLPVFSQKKNVLFLGNSYTAVNNLPQLVSDLATSAGDTLSFDSNTPGGYTFQQHFNDATSKSKIMQGTWDFVVLQEQSQRPSFPLSQVQLEVFPYAFKLDSLINQYNACGETMFYMTWGRKNGDASNCASWPPVCTYQGMDSLLYLRYMMMADDNDAVVSPVGALWKYIRNNYPSISLYDTDESHPSVAGSYAAACSFYACIFRKNPLNITSNSSLAQVDALIIRQAAKTIVYDSLFKWHVGEYDPAAAFTFNTNTNTVNFTNLSTHATDYHWDFGDGNSSTDANPVNTYASVGNFTVELIARYCSRSDTFTNIVPVTVLGLTYENSEEFKIYPNPTGNTLFMSHQDKTPVCIEIFDAQATLVLSEKILNCNMNSIDVTALPAGIYTVKITFKDNVISRKFAKK